MAMRLLLAFILLFLTIPPVLLAQSAAGGTWLVLPLVSQSDQKNVDWIGEAFAEAVGEALRAQGELVVDRESRQEAERRLALRPNKRWTLASVLKLAESLDASHVVFGIYELADARTPQSVGWLRVSAQTLAVQEFRAEAKHELSGPVEDLANLEAVLASRVRGAQDLAAPALGSRVRVTAIENYVRGLLSEDLGQKRKFFEQAIKIEPRYSPAAFQLGKLQYEQAEYSAAIDALDRVQTSDGNYWQASFRLGLARLATGDPKGAERAFSRTLRELPLPEVANNLGIAQMQAAMAEALPSLRQALQGDERDPDYHFNLGLIFMLRGEWAPAADQFRATLDREEGETEATKLLGRCLKPPTSVTAELTSELVSLARPKEELNEFAYRQFRAILIRRTKP
jgi:tetratricopeptide (TPR) repeat protein